MNYAAPVRRFLMERFARAIQQRNLWATEMSLCDLGDPVLVDALAYLDLLAEQKPEKRERAAVQGVPRGFYATEARRPRGPYSARAAGESSRAWSRNARRACCHRYARTGRTGPSSRRTG